MSKDSFVLALESRASVMSSMSDGKQIIILLKRRDPKDVTYVPINCDNKLDWVPRVYDELNRTKRVVLVSEKQPYCGALGFVKKLRSDGMDKIGLVVIDDFHAPSFNPSTGIYKNQLEKDLSVNIFIKGQWGGYYYTRATQSTNLRNVTLANETGSLDDLKWIEKPATVAKNNIVQILQRIITEGIANGTVRPISRIEYSPIEISRAFRLLSSSKNVGKVLIKMRSPEILKQGFDVIPRSWAKHSVTIKISTDNLQTQNGCTKMLKEASRTGSVKGIFIVPDFEDENDENAVDFVPMFNKTALAVINLNLTSKNYCNELR